ncbi:MAG: right-handed parallel beta-helix repeat-containing protein [Acidobacteriaceae bacterium]|nr:right-handed parallel beta-helix repeat-containing protein [Acidobacteriaceae bacterium]
MQELPRKFLIAVLCCIPALAHASTFYVDSASGNDANSGTSPTLAWSSLAPVNQHTFMPGDHILLHAGQSWSGAIEAHGNGTTENPITLGSYGEGAKPLIQGQGVSAVLTLRDVSGWTVEDISITNHGDSQDPRLGILIETSKYAFALHLVRVDIRDVNGQLSKEAGGIGIIPDGHGHPAHFDDILIDHCIIRHMAGMGIFLHVLDRDNHAYLNTHVRLTGNTIVDIGKNAIFLRGTTDGLIDHNKVRFAAAHEHGNAICVGWSKHTTVSYNEVSETGLHTGPFDGGAVDVDDGSISTVVEYNWSHDNVAGFGVGSQPNDNCDAIGTIIRYNLSENDSVRVFSVHGHDRSTAIYNNTAFIGQGHSPAPVHTGRYKQNPELPDTILFARNVFFNEGDLTFDWKAKNIMTDGNCYFGNAPKSPLEDKHIVRDQTMNISGAPIRHRDEAGVYSLPAGSACGAMLPALPNENGTDFLGTPLSNATPGIRGAIVSAATTNR